VNKHQRAEIKKCILALIDSLNEDQSHLAKDSGAMLRLQRLKTALMRIDADNFGKCFKCDSTIPICILKNSPATMLCPACIEEQTE
jgi:RNA polymerase-binding transcription factor DksA